MKRTNGVATNLFSQYVQDFIWRRKFGGNEAMLNLWNQISQQKLLEVISEQKN
jgi:hypothetical protein